MKLFYYVANTSMPTLCDLIMEMKNFSTCCHDGSETTMRNATSSCTEEFANLEVGDYIKNASKKWQVLEIQDDMIICTKSISVYLQSMDDYGVGKVIHMTPKYFSENGYVVLNQFTKQEVADHFGVDVDTLDIID